MIGGPLPTSLSHLAVRAVMGALACLWAGQHVSLRCSSLAVHCQSQSGAKEKCCSEQPRSRRTEATVQAAVLSYSSACTLFLVHSGQAHPAASRVLQHGTTVTLLLGASTPMVGVKAPFYDTPGACGLPAAAACACEPACARLRTHTHCLSMPTAPQSQEAGPAGALLHSLLLWALPGAAPALLQPQGWQTVLKELGVRKPSQRGAQGPGRCPSTVRVHQEVTPSHAQETCCRPPQARAALLIAEPGGRCKYKRSRRAEAPPQACLLSRHYAPRACVLCLVPGEQAQQATSRIMQYGPVGLCCRPHPRPLAYSCPPPAVTRGAWKPAAAAACAQQGLGAHSAHRMPRVFATTTVRRALRELCGIPWRSECSAGLRKPASTHGTGGQAACTTYRASLTKTGGPLPLTGSPTQWQSWCAQVRWAASASPVPSPGSCRAPPRRAWWARGKAQQVQL